MYIVIAAFNMLSLQLIHINSDNNLSPLITHLLVNFNGGKSLRRNAIAFRLDKGVGISCK
jgi:hypothetical protein